MANEASKTALLTTMKNELYKSHFVYDGENRVTHHYQARKDAPHQGVCLVTKFTYVTGTSLTEGSIEYEGQWNSDWDVAEGA